MAEHRGQTVTAPWWLLWAPLAVLTVACGHARVNGIDLTLADWLYRLQGGAWTLRYDFVLSEILHSKAQVLANAVHMTTLCIACASLCLERLAPLRRSLTYVTLASLVSIAIVVVGKQLLPEPCPSALARYGGTLPFADWYDHSLIAWGHGCFPAAHASTGYALLPWFFFARRHALAGTWRYLLPGVLSGGLFGAAQQIRGAHFLSHDLGAAAICWAAAWVLARLVLPSSLSQPLIGSRFAGGDLERCYNAQAAVDIVRG